jgi:PST family polysaccharide transporter
MVAGAAWMTMLRIASRVLGFASVLILARLLAPTEFGVVALATSIVGGVAVLGEFSFDMALIQRREATRAYYDTVWTLTILRNLAIAAALLFAAAPIARFYASPVLEWALQVLAALIAIESIQNVGVVDFRKHLLFKREFWFSLLPRLAGVAVAIPAAFALRSFWALIAGIAAQRLTSVVASYTLHPYRPRWSLSESSEIVRFSAWLLGNNVVRFGLERLPLFVIGHGGNLGAVGTYDVAKEFAELPTTELIFPVSRAVFPGLVTLAEDREALRSTVIDVLGLVVCLGLPLVIGIALTADLLVSILLGPSWLEAIPCLRVLALSAVLTVGFANAGALFIAIGRPDLTLILNLVQLAATAIALAIWFPANGATGAAWAVVTGAAVRLAINHLFLGRVLKIAALAVARSVWRPVTAVSAMSLAVIAISSDSGLAVGDGIVELMVRAATGIAVYGAVLWLLWRLSGRPDSTERQILSWLRSRLC